MPRFSAGCRTSAGSTTLPIISIYNGATAGGNIVEIGVSNTTTTAVAVKLTRITTAGTQGSGLTESHHDMDSAATANCTTFNTHSSTGPSLGEDLGYAAVLGAAAGSTIIWTFGGTGLRIGAADAVTAVTDGIGVIVATGTGQVCDAWIVWDE